MGGGKETPRQKMVGLMYLVLMALLAMNVSKEIILAFVTLNNDMANQNQNVQAANGGAVDMLYGKANSPELGPKEKAEIKVWLDKAIEVHNMTKRSANFYIDNAQEMLAAGMPGEWIDTGDDGFKFIVDLNNAHYGKKDDYDTPTRLFVGDNHTTISDKGQALRTNMENYRDSLCIMIGDKKKEKGDGRFAFAPPEGFEKKNDTDTSFLTGLDEALANVKESDRTAIKEIYRLLTMPQKVMNHGHEVPWQAGMFDHSPQAAAAAMFTSMKGKILAAEKIALANFNAQSSAPPFKFNKIEPLAFSSTAYINQGDSLDLAVMIAAYDSTAKKEVEYWLDDTLMSPENKQSSAEKYISFSGGVGEHTVSGRIAVETKAGKEWKRFRDFKYSVGSPSAAVAAADLAVLYRGWKNRIKVSASGYDPSAVSVSCNSGCKISGSPDKDGYYIAEAKSGKEAFITVSAEGAELAKERFRIFPLPQPQPYFAGQTFNKTTIKKSSAGAAPKIIAKLGDSPLDVPYKVTEFQMLLIKNGKAIPLKSKSSNLTPQMKDAIKKMGKGQSLTFLGIKAAGPSGKAIPIPGLAFKLI